MIFIKDQEYLVYAKLLHITEWNIALKQKSSKFLSFHTCKQTIHDSNCSLAVQTKSQHYLEKAGYARCSFLSFQNVSSYYNFNKIKEKNTWKKVNKCKNGKLKLLYLTAVLCDLGQEKLLKKTVKFFFSFFKPMRLFFLACIFPVHPRVRQIF